MTFAVLIMGALGLTVGIGLAFASKIFYVYVDPIILQIEDVLPGANCGGCGLPGCSSNAEAIAAGKASPNSCVAAGPEVAEAIAAIMGVSMEASEPDIALPGCTYGVKDADTKYEYDGLKDCRAAALLGGGMKVCDIGCLGFGTCAQVCPFNAITMGPQGLPVVNENLCTGCGTCERACPKNIINLSSVTRRIMREYTTDNCTTPCQRACPAGIDICEYIDQIRQGDYHRATQVIKERNPFPTVIGRICPRPCENECRRQYVDEPVAINFLKRFAADYEHSQGQRTQPYKAPATGRKVAIVGGGVEGLSTAFFTARLGHAPVVFEATDRLGGLLRTAISTQRLPQDILDWDIQGVLEMGVTAETGKAMGKDFSLYSLLKDEYQAVFLASGGWDSRLARNAGGKIESPIAGIYLLLDYLRFASSKVNNIDCGSNVTILGGGELALEAARRSKEMGAKKITIVFRDLKTELPDNVSLDSLENEGIYIRHNTGILRLIGEEEKIASVELMDLASGEKELLPTNSLVFATGRFPEMIFRVVNQETEDDTFNDGTATIDATVEQWEGFPPYKHPLASDTRGLFAEGDPLTDFSGAIKAIGAGRRAAASIHKGMYGISLDLPENVLTSEIYIQNVDHVDNVPAIPREIMPLANHQELVQGQEIEKGFDASGAKKEASRCLKCGLICYQHSSKDKTVQIQPAINA
jgi:NADPH-dependent glutamate synthase beta subunit-like oxidoreductase